MEMAGPGLVESGVDCLFLCLVLLLSFWVLRTVLRFAMPMLLSLLKFWLTILAIFCFILLFLAYKYPRFGRLLRLVLSDLRSGLVQSEESMEVQYT